MAFKAIERLLKQRMGLHSATVGSGTVAQAVEQRMLACGIDSPHDYLLTISHSATELAALIDTVVIPETWFYRDQNPFSAFSDWVKSTWLARNSLQTLRVLSVPCSSGEEPYSLAMCLADLGLPAYAAEIEAVNISHHNLETAAAALYGDNSFRCKDLAFRDKHFIEAGSCYQLNDDIRARVNFAYANILDDGFLLHRRPYDVIFCRNLLIYFDRPTQNRVIDVLENLLQPNGVLFLGHSETSLLLERDFSALDCPRCFGFQRIASPTDCTARSTTPGTSPPLPPASRRRAATKNGVDLPRPFAGILQSLPKKLALHSAGSADKLLNKAVELADQGHLDEAVQHCETLIQRRQHQAEAHFLLGLVRQAAGSIEDAAQMFRKTIYLDPDHYQALAHLGVICQQQGDSVSAQRFQQRAARAQLRKRTEKEHQ